MGNGDSPPSFVWSGKNISVILAGVLLIFLVAYNLWQGLTVQEIGVPGFTVKFGKPEAEDKGMPRQAATAPATATTEPEVAPNGNDVVEHEKRIWEDALFYHERANDVTTNDEIYHFAEEAVKKWQAYVEWHRGLSDDGREQLTVTGSDSDRIQRVVKLLGNAIVRRGNRQGHTVNELFDTYLDIPADYISTQSLRLWRVWLFRCPEWEEVANQPLDRLDEYLAQPMSCREEWESHLDFLVSWKDVQDLTPARKASTLRDIEKIDAALKL